MRVGCCIKGAWFVKGVANRGGCDKPQNNNGWHEPEFELWTSPAMEALCSSVTPSPLSDRWQCERNGMRNSRETVRVGYLAPQCQRLYFFFSNLGRNLFGSSELIQCFIRFCWYWNILTNNAKLFLQANKEMRLETNLKYTKLSEKWICIIQQFRRSKFALHRSFAAINFATYENFA